VAKLVVDFKGVESGGGGGGARVPEDDYRVKVVEVKMGESKAGNSMLIWQFEITSGKYKGKKLKREYTTLTKDSLWKLLSLLEAMGFNVAKKKLDIAPIIKKAMGKELGVTVIDEEYEDKMQSKISDYVDLETLESAGNDDDDEDADDDEDSDDDDAEDEAPKKKKKGKKDKKKSKKSDDDDIEDLDLDEL
jgi:hypothetical protein